MDFFYEPHRDVYKYPHAEFGLLGAKFHMHQIIEMIYVIRGTLRIELATGGGISLLVHPGEMAVINCGTPHSTIPSDGMWYMLCFIPIASLTHELRPPTGMVFTKVYRESESGILSSMLEAMVKMTKTYESDESRVRLSAFANAVMSLVMPELRGSMSQLTSNEIRVDITSYIYKNYRNPDLTAKSIGLAVGFSARSVELSVKESVGKTVKELITELRVNDAKLLLRSTDDNVESIGFSVGFESPRTFFRVFREKVGMTPSEYRESEG